MLNADPLDSAQNEWIRIAEERDETTPVGKLILALYDAVAAMDEPSEVCLLSSIVDPVVTEKRLQFQAKPGIVVHRFRETRTLIHCQNQTIWL